MNSIDYSKLRSVTAREIISALIRDGFFLHHQRGSHQRYRHPDGRKVSLAFHRGSQTFPPKTLRNIIERQAQWSEDDLRRLRLIKN